VYTYTHTGYHPFFIEPGLITWEQKALIQNHQQALIFLNLDGRRHQLILHQIIIIVGLDIKQKSYKPCSAADDCLCPWSHDLHPRSLVKKPALPNIRVIGVGAASDHPAWVVWSFCRHKVYLAVNRITRQEQRQRPVTTLHACTQYNRLY